MTDEEKFQKTFDKLHASPDVLTEVLKMTAKEQVVPMKKKRFTPKAAAAIAAVVLAAGSGSAAYAMDVGGIQRCLPIPVSQFLIFHHPAYSFTNRFRF